MTVTSLLSIAVVSAEPLKIDIQPAGLDEATTEALQKMVLDSPRLKKRLQGIRYRVVEADFGDEQKVDPTANMTGQGQVSLKIYDYTNDKLITARSGMSLADSEVSESDEQPNPTPAEYEEARKILEMHPVFGSKVKSGRLKPYEAMPPTIDLRDAEGQRQERIISVGLKPAHGKLKHEIVGVNLSRGDVVRFATGAPPTAIAGVDHCGFPNAYQYTTSRGTYGTATVRVSRNGVNLWTFNVTRPSASSGRQGSAIDLKKIYYRGTKVLDQAHIPILNVHYDNNVCGPYRDWQYSENAFQATGTNLAAGIRRTSTRPTTIFDTGRDYGNFRGVAIYDDGAETVLMTEISAGWYRYIVEYRFHEDGTISPLMKFTGVENSCICRTHHHNVYWRMDFDIAAETPNAVEVFNGSSWTRLATEAKQYRNGANRAWRVINTSTNAGYTITPGSNDGVADSYARGDVWALRYRAYQLEDSRVRTSTAANLDAFVTGESIANADVVFWYAGHFTHDAGDESRPHVLGPVLRPVNWRAE